MGREYIPMWHRGYRSALAIASSMVRCASTKEEAEKAILAELEECRKMKSTKQVQAEIAAARQKRVGKEKP